MGRACGENRRGVWKLVRDARILHAQRAHERTNAANVHYNAAHPHYDKSQ